MEVITHIKVHAAYPVGLCVYVCGLFVGTSLVWVCVWCTFVCMWEHAHMYMLKPEVSVGCLPQLFFILFFSFHVFKKVALLMISQSGTNLVVHQQQVSQ